jgi:hypothetical protein
VPVGLQNFMHRRKPNLRKQIKLKQNKIDGTIVFIVPYGFYQEDYIYAASKRYSEND